MGVHWQGTRICEGQAEANLKLQRQAVTSPLTEAKLLASLTCRTPVMQA